MPLRKTQAEFFGKISDVSFAGDNAIVASGCAGGDKLGYFTAKADFGLIGEIAGASDAA